MPTSSMIRYPRPNLNEPLDEPFDGALYFFTPDIELPEHVQEVVSQNPHLQPGFVSLKPVAAGLVPAKRVLPFLDPVLNLASAIIHFDYFEAWKSRVGYDEANPGK